MTYILIILALLAAGLLILFYNGFFFAALYMAYFVMIFCVFALAILMVHFYRVIILGNAPYIRTGKKLINRIIEEIDFSAKGGSASGGQENAKVYELGSGDGRFLRALAKKKKIEAVGFENFILPYAISRIAKFLTHSNVEIRYQDLFKADLSDADYIFCYLITKQMDKLEVKLQNELKPGALIISNTFKFQNWPLEKEIIIDPKKKFSLSNKINIYRKV
jgi:hypothetical protein